MFKKLSVLLSFTLVLFLAACQSLDTETLGEYAFDGYEVVTDGQSNGLFGKSTFSIPAGDSNREKKAELYTELKDALGNTLELEKSKLIYGINEEEKEQSEVKYKVESEEEIVLKDELADGVTVDKIIVKEDGKLQVILRQEFDKVDGKDSFIEIVLNYNKVEAAEEN